MLIDIPSLALDNIISNLTLREFYVLKSVCKYLSIQEHKKKCIIDIVNSSIDALLEHIRHYTHELVSQIDIYKIEIYYFEGATLILQIFPSRLLNLVFRTKYSVTTLYNNIDMFELQRVLKTKTIDKILEHIDNNLIMKYNNKFLSIAWPFSGPQLSQPIIGLDAIGFKFNQ